MRVGTADVYRIGIEDYPVKYEIRQKFRKITPIKSYLHYLLSWLWANLVKNRDNPFYSFLREKTAFQVSVYIFVSKKSIKFLA